MLNLPDNSSLQQSRFRGWLTRPAFWFVVALVIRLLYMLEQGGTSPLFYQPLLDEKEAYDSAMALLKGVSDSEPYFKAPGYSWIFAAVLVVSGEGWPWVLRTLQHLAGAGVVWMGAWLAGRLSPAGKWRGAAIGIAGFLGALYAPLIRLESNISLDFWVVFFQSAMLCCLARLCCRGRAGWRVALGAGCLAGAAWIIRPTITPVLPLIAIWVVWAGAGGPGRRGFQTRRGLIQSGLFLLPVAVIAGAVLARNVAVSGVPMVLPWQGGYSLYYANRAGATGRYLLQDRIVESAHANPTRDLSILAYVSELSPLEKQRFKSDPDFKAVNRYWFERTVEEIRQDPTGWLGLMMRKGVYLFSDKEIFNYEDYDLQRSRSALLWWMPGRFGVVFPLALASLAALTLPRFRRRRRIFGLLGIYVAALGGAIALYYVSGRMRMPLAFPFIAMAGVGGGALVWLPPGRKAAAAALLVAVGILAWGDWWGVRSESMAHVDLARMSNAAWHQQRYEQALELAVEAEEISPDYPVIPRLKGQALFELGRLEESAREFERSVRLLGDESSRRNLRVVLEELERTKGKG